MPTLYLGSKELQKLIGEEDDKGRHEEFRFLKQMETYERQWSFRQLHNKNALIYLMDIHNTHLGEPLTCSSGLVKDDDFSDQFRRLKFGERGASLDDVQADFGLKEDDYNMLNEGLKKDLARIEAEIKAKHKLPASDRLTKGYD